MADLKLSDGREFSVDLHKVTLREYAFFRANVVSDPEAFAIMGKVVGLTLAEVEGLTRNQQADLLMAIIIKGNQPLTDPNSQSASTSA